MKKDADFDKRQRQAQLEVNFLDQDVIEDEPKRQKFFESVYQQAKGDAAKIPWANLEPKEELVQWLAKHGPHQGKAVDIGCGLGDNAEALASAGYQTTGFDLSKEAIEWTKKRFPETTVHYVPADLFNLPPEWIGGYDVVFECYTLQAMPPETLAESIAAVCSLVAPDGLLLLYSRLRDNGAEVDGPPWPLEVKELDAFKAKGFVLEEDTRFDLYWRERYIPHTFSVWRKSA